MNLRVRMFVKSAVKDHKFCCSYDWLVTTSCRPIRSVISVMKQITLSPHGRQILFYHLYELDSTQSYYHYLSYHVKPLQRPP